MASGSHLGNRPLGLQPAHVGIRERDWAGAPRPTGVSPPFVASITERMIGGTPHKRRRMDNRDSGLFRLASVGSYLDSLSMTDEMTLKERSNLIFLDRCLHELWGLGQNVILNWCPDGDGITLIVIPHYGVAAYSASTQIGPVSSATDG